MDAREPTDYDSMSRIDAGVALADALEFMGERSSRVLIGLSDEEFLWTPIERCWTIRARRVGETPGSSTCVGRGDYVLDDATEDPDPPPFTTIAWRLGHAILINRMFSRHVLGDGELLFDDVEMPHMADQAVQMWRQSYESYVDALRNHPDPELELEREIELPWGRRGPQSVRELTLVVLHENVHHLAEVGVLRDLFRSNLSR